jgi:predicted nucleic acid-binding protein
VVDMHEADELVILDMTDTELRIASQLVSPSGCKAFGLKFPLGPGEAACIAIGTTRDLVIATDDADALRALRTMAPNHSYERIRKLLVRAVETRTISEAEANQLHTEMRRLGFWDTTSPFPKVKTKRQA